MPQSRLPRPSMRTGTPKPADHPDTPSSERVGSAAASPVGSAHEVMSASVLEMVSTLGHEVLTPLASILGYAETLLRVGDRLSPEEQREFLQAILTAGARLDLLIKRLLELAHGHDATLVMAEPIDLVALAQHTLANGQRLATQTERAFTFRLCLQAHVLDVVGERAENLLEEDHLYMTWGDPQRVRFVFEHLLENAIKFTPAGGRIELHITRAPQSQGQQTAPTLQVSVHDEGIGIPADHLQRIFLPFQQADASLTRETSGLGVGLALCQQIITAHGGVIWAESTSRQGSVFHFTLPCLADVLPGQQPQKPL